MLRYLIVVLLLALPASAAPKFESSLRLGVAQSDGWNFQNKTPMGELQLSLSGNTAKVTVGVRHGFDMDSPLGREKSRLKFNLDVPLTKSIAYFAEVEKPYLTGDDWGWTGLTFRLK